MRHRLERGRMSLALAIAVGLAGVVSLAGIVQAHGNSGENGNNGPNGGGQGEGHTPVTICHWVPAHGGSYVVITIDDDGLHGHGGHENDIIPAPAGGCPGAATHTPVKTPTAGAATHTPVKTPTVGGATHTPVKTPTVGGATHTPVKSPSVTRTPDDNGGGVFPCPDGYESIKVDPPVSGTYGGIQVTFSADLKSVSFVSPFLIDIVIVKGGPDANIYGPNSDGLPAFSLSGLVAPLNPGGQQPDISFVTFCFQEDKTVTPTGTAAVDTATPTKTRTPTATGTAAVSTTTPTATNTAVSTATATGTAAGATSTPVTATVTSTPSGNGGATSTPVTGTATGTVAAATSTPVTATPTGAGVVGAATSTPQQGVLGQQVGPAARGGVTLPSAGQGGSTGGDGFVLGFAALAIAGIGFTSLLLLRRRMS